MVIPLDTTFSGGATGPRATLSSRARCITRAYTVPQRSISSHSLQLALPLSVLLVFARRPRKGSPAMQQRTSGLRGAPACTAPRSPEWGICGDGTPLRELHWRSQQKFGPDAADPPDTFRGKISPGRRDRPRRRQPRPTTHTRETPKRCKSPLQTPSSQHPAAAIPSATTDLFPGSAPSPPRPERRQQQQR